MLFCSAPDMDKRSLLRGSEDDAHGDHHAGSEEFMIPPEMMDDDEFESTIEKSHNQKNHGYFRFFPIIATKSWLLASFALNLGFIMLVLFQIIIPNVASSQSTIFKGRTITTHFKARTEYMSLDHSYDIFWEELLINKSHWPALAFGKDHDKWLGRATITMVHQIHCLQSLREAMQQATEGKDIGMDWRDNPHWPHCFDTLLQSIVCYADNTIERPDIRDGVVGHAISGYNVERQCRDAGPVYELFESKGIIWPPPTTE